MAFEISIDGKRFFCQAEKSVLMAMVDNGLAILPVGCRAGGCGVCKIKVLQGTFHTKVMSRAKVSAAEQQQGYALACRLYPDSDMTIEKAPVDVESDEEINER